jgi:RNA polymerase sigma-70 factor (ECF subfamily)
MEEDAPLSRSAVHGAVLPLEGTAAFTAGAVERAAVAAPGAAPAAIALHAGEADETLMLAYAAGDAGAFNRLYQRHERPVYRFLLRSLGSARRNHRDAAAAADDLLQETWLAVIRNAASYVPSARFTTWLYAIARSKLIDYWRVRDPLAAGALSLDGSVDAANDDAITLAETLPAADHVRPDVQAMARATASAFIAAVEQLPLPQREAFLLHAEGGLSVEELAATTGVGFETAKSRLRYAMSRLRSAMEAWR